MNEKQLTEILTTQYGLKEPALEFLREGGGRTYLNPLNKWQERIRERI